MKRKELRLWLSKAFDKHATDPEKEGTGLRLAIVKQIVEAHGVTVNAESVHGTGPTFTLALRMLLASICAFHQPYFFSHPQNRIHFRRDRGEEIDLWISPQHSNWRRPPPPAPSGRGSLREWRRDSDDADARHFRASRDLFSHALRVFARPACVGSSVNCRP